MLGGPMRTWWGNWNWLNEADRLTVLLDVIVLLDLLDSKVRVRVRPGV
jgi:hypothetical protein